MRPRLTPRNLGPTGVGKEKLFASQISMQLDTLLIVYPLHPPSLVEDLRLVFKVHKQSSGGVFGGARSGKGADGVLRTAEEAKGGLVTSGSTQFNRSLSTTRPTSRARTRRPSTTAPRPA